MTSGAVGVADAAVLTRIIAARRAHLDDLIAEWPTGERAGVAQQLREIVESLVPDVDPARIDAAS